MVEIKNVQAEKAILIGVGLKTDSFPELKESLFELEELTYVKGQSEGVTYVRQEPEGLTYVGSMNKGQQAYYTEFGRFSNSLADLGIGISTETYNYSYRIVSPMVPVQDASQLTQPTSFQNVVMILGQPKHPSVRGYLGVVSVVEVGGRGGRSPVAALCRLNRPRTLPGTMPTLTNVGPQCPKGSTRFN